MIRSITSIISIESRHNIKKAKNVTTFDSAEVCPVSLHPFPPDLSHILFVSMLLGHTSKTSFQNRFHGLSCADPSRGVAAESR